MPTTKESDKVTTTEMLKTATKTHKHLQKRHYRHKTDAKNENKKDENIKIQTKRPGNHCRSQQSALEVAAVSFHVQVDLRLDCIRAQQESFNGC